MTLSRSLLRGLTRLCLLPGPGRRRRWLVGVAGAVLLAGIATRLATFSSPAPATAQPTSHTTTPRAPRPGGTAAGAAANLAPNGVFTALEGNGTTVAALHGKDMTVAALRDKPTLLWFLVTGCSSCVASAPAIAKNLLRIEADGVHVVALDLYGDLPPTPQGWGQLAAWAANNAGPAWSSSDWTWGMASKALSLAYDPGGTPDLYVVIGPGGHLRYQNSVPVSTMGQLLAAAGNMTGHTVSTGPPTGPTTSTGPTLP